jgi:hypothetical protein
LYILSNTEINIYCHYRGISLLNSSYKIYANIISNRVHKISGNILKEEQSGFRKGRPCKDCAFAITKFVEKINLTFPHKLPS